jgi:putative colanic acid biosynthesis UDP-glucose lipid carrier transferase
MPEIRNVPNFARAPQSITSLLAAFVDPSIAVAVYLAGLWWAGAPVLCPDLTLCLLVFALGFPGRNRFRDRQLNAAVDIATTWVKLLLLLAIGAVATDSFRHFDADLLVSWSIVTPVLQMVVVMIGRRVVEWEATQPARRRKAVIIGAASLGVRVATALSSSRLLGIDFMGYFDDRADARVQAGQRLGTLMEAPDYIRARGVKDVYITLALGSQPRIIQLLEALQGTTASIFFVPDVFGISIIQGRLREVNGLPIVGLCESPITGANRLAKRISDVTLSLLVLLLTWPLLLAIAIGVKLGSPGPVIFKQRRNGLHGEEIVIYKFRTMRAEDDGPDIRQATREDPRVTPFGAFLRRTSLDELPQFFNVLQGRMSIVGPRPHAVAHNEQYREMIKAYMVRHKVKPGITGWAQVNGLRGETDTVEKMQARVEYDLAYLRNWSLGFDLQIIARTIKLVFFDRNAF